MIRSPIEKAASLCGAAVLLALGVGYQPCFRLRMRKTKAMAARMEIGMPKLRRWPPRAWSVRSTAGDHHLFLGTIPRVLPTLAMI
jgi:hypothetical protein